LIGLSPYLGENKVFRYTGSVKIYIVDDASFIRMICRYHLTKAGHNIVGESHDGEMALTEILAIQPECVLVDLSLPSKSGVEIMTEVQSKYPHIQFIIVTALDRDILALTAPDVGYAGYIRKPFEGADLVKAVESLQTAPDRRKYG
jgi:DNA-binding NarL/FixJ family response regulator